MCLQGLLPLVCILYLVVWLLSMYKPCHVIHAQWTSYSSYTLLRHLWPYLPTWFFLPLPISWQLDPVSTPRSSITHTSGGPHTNPSRLSQANICGGRNTEPGRLALLWSMGPKDSWYHQDTCALCCHTFKRVSAIDWKSPRAIQQTSIPHHTWQRWAKHWGCGFHFQALCKELVSVWIVW